MLGSPCFHHPRGIETNKFWTNRTLDVQLVISQLRNKKGWIATNRLHFPTRRSKVQIHIGFQVLIAAAFYANLRPDPALLLILAGMGWLLVSLDLWFSLHFIVSGCVCKLSKSIYDLTRLARQVHTQNEGLLEKDVFSAGEPLFW